MIKNYSWGGRRRGAQPKRDGKFELDPIDKIQAKMDQLDKKVSKINLASSNPSKVHSFSCDICGGTNHDNAYCGGTNHDNSYCGGTYSEDVVAINSRGDGYQGNQGYRRNQQGGWKQPQQN